MASLKQCVFVVLLSSIHSCITAKDNVFKDYKNYKWINVNGNREGLEYLKEFIANQTQDGSIFFLNLNDASQVLLPPELIPVFNRICDDKELRRDIVHEDVSEIINEEKQLQQRYKNKFSWKAYYDVDDIYRYLKNMSSLYPEWVETIEGGKSYEGRPILGLRINSLGQNNYTEHKPVFFIESGIHAREWIAPATTTYFINQLLTSSDPQIIALRDEFDWRIFPTVNPDGYHYSYVYDRYWRKTRSRSSNGCRGADPNRNWDYNWGRKLKWRGSCRCRHKE